MIEFSDVVGHSDIIDYMQSAIKLDKVAHAYIFSGEKGMGKTMLAELFAQLLVCESHKEGAINGKDAKLFCGECRSCAQAMSKNHPDVKVLQREKVKTIGVDEIREQINNDIVIKPYNSQKKIYIIPEAHLMTEQAQNALLKTIEEPPHYAMIILLAESAESMLATIQSRCVVLRFKNIRDTQVIRYLIEQEKLPDYEAKICAAFAQGNIGKGKVLGSSEKFDEIKKKAVFMLSRIHGSKVAEMGSFIKEVVECKDDINDYLDIVAVWYRDVLMYKTTGDINKVVFQENITAIKDRAKESNYEGIEQILLGIEKVKQRLKANVNFDLSMELLLLTMKEN